MVRIDSSPTEKQGAPAALDSDRIGATQCFSVGFESSPTRYLLRGSALKRVPGGGLCGTELPKDTRPDGPAWAKDGCACGRTGYDPALPSGGCRAADVVFARSDELARIDDGWTRKRVVECSGRRAGACMSGKPGVIDAKRACDRRYLKWVRKSLIINGVDLV